jgi:hypothetical protein
MELLPTPVMTALIGNQHRHLGIFRTRRPSRPLALRHSKMLCQGKDAQVPKKPARTARRAHSNIRCFCTFIIFIELLY